MARERLRDTDEAPVAPAVKRERLSTPQPKPAGPVEGWSTLVIGAQVPFYYKTFRRRNGESVNIYLGSIHIAYADRFTDHYAAEIGDNYLLYFVGKSGPQAYKYSTILEVLERVVNELFHARPMVEC